MTDTVFSLLLSALMNLCMMGINYVHYQNNGWFLFGLRSHGGEISIEYTVGLTAVHIYAMTPEESNSHSLRFSPLLLLASIVVLFFVLRPIVSFVRSRYFPKA